MVRLCAIISLAFSFVFYTWNLSHGRINWTFFLILGILLAVISQGWDYAPPWRRPA